MAFVPTQNKKQDNHALLQRLQSEAIMLGSDLKKQERIEMDIVNEKRQVKRRMASLESELIDIEIRMKKVEKEKYLLTNDIASLKKKINLASNAL